MPKTINANELESVVIDMLNDYGDGCEEVLEEAVTKTAKSAQKELRGKNSGSFVSRSGKYRKGWKTKIEKTRLSVEGIVYNSNSPGLTHLLEFGHALQNGGRAKAYPHIAEANDNAAEMIETELMEKL